MNNQEILDLLVKFKLPLGFGSWDVNLASNKKGEVFISNLGAAHATITVNRYKQTLFKIGRASCRERV